MQSQSTREVVSLRSKSSDLHCPTMRNDRSRRSVRSKRSMGGSCGRWQLGNVDCFKMDAEAPGRSRQLVKTAAKRMYEVNSKTVALEQVEWS